MTDKFLEGLEHIDEFAREVKRTVRTVKRWTDLPDGLPFVKLGRDTFIPIDLGRGWIRRRIIHRNPRKG